MLVRFAGRKLIFDRPAENHGAMMGRLVAVILCLFSVLAHAVGKPDVILITLDSTRADRMGFLGAKGKLTPNLDGMARQSIVFERAYAQAPASLVSHATILTGVYPPSHHVSPLGSLLAASIPYFPALLHDHGYKTSAFVGSIELDPWHGPAAGLNRGFDNYSAPFHAPQVGESRYRSVERRASEIVAAASSWLATNAQHEFFVWIQLNDAHAPYESAPGAEHGAAYDRQISYVDAEIGKFLNALRTRKIYDNALIIVTASQGESLGAHGEDTHGVFLYDETVHVPLLIKVPGNRLADKRVPGRVRLVDLAPTILEVAGLAVPSQMEGQSLLRAAQMNADLPVYVGSQYPRWAFGWSELQSWRAGKFLFIRAPRPELYDLNADPGATRNLAQTSKATLDTLAAQLDGFDRHFSAGAASNAELSSAEMQKLASLGYVGLQKRTANANSSLSGTDPKDVIASANKTEGARLAIENGQPEKAITALQVLIAAQPNMYLPQYLLGVAEEQLHRYPEAIAHFRKAIELQPESPWAHYEMGLSLLKSSDFKSAAVYLEIASTHLPQFPQAHASLADAYDRLGKAEDAKRERSKAEQLSRDASR
jgi:arylsulfatase A-like enzyme/Flp pilus assembly protein TadD